MDVVVLIGMVWLLILLYGIRRRLKRLPDLSELESHVRDLGYLITRLEMRNILSGTAAPPPPPKPEPPPIPVAPSILPPPVFAAPPLPPSPLQTPMPSEPKAPGVFETAAREMLRKAWNWFVVGEEFRRPDVSAEFAIATNWLMRAGILLLVVGVGFFLNYSITRGLLGPSARVVLSVLAGTGLIVWGLRLLGRKYHLLGQGFVGGGLAMLYFSIYSAAVMFGLLPVGPAFALMALVTAAACVLAVRQDSLLVAVLGLLGGYATPMMLSTGAKNFPVLFGYLTLLGIGLLGVAWRKRWPILTYLSLFSTHLLSWAAITAHYEDRDLGLVLSFLFVFFALFSTAIFLYNLSKKERATVIELLGLFLNVGFFFGIGYQLIARAHPRTATAWLAAGLALYYTAHVVALLRRGPKDRALLTAFIAMAASFLVLTLPLLLTGSWLTACWAVQAVALIWIAIRLESRLLRKIAEGLLLVVLGRLLFLDFGRSFSGATPARWADYARILADRAIQFGLPILSFGAARVLLARRAKSDPSEADASEAPVSGGWERLESRFALGFGLAVLFFYLSAESYDLFTVLSRPLRLPVLTLVWAGFGGYLLLRRESLGRRTLIGLFWGALIVLSIKWLVDMGSWVPHFQFLAYRAAERTSVRALIRLLDVAAVLAFFIGGWKLLRGDSERHAGRASGWLALALGLLYLTFETGTGLTRFLPGFRAGGISLLWGLYALGLVGGGIRYASRPLRLVGLALFSVTLVKIFFSDLDGLSTVFRFIAFIALGIVLLFASFLYMRFKGRVEER
ncbi:MAG: DUF2339 domain-containing protein [Kiritimatiellia bacterium]|nr:DUF2339 domain-containing protein [Kiritimatiellia bacterium]